MLCSFAKETMIWVGLKFRLFLAVNCILLSCSSVVDSTGLRGRITRPGLDYASRVAIEMLMKQLSGAEIPDQYEQMGSMTVVLTNITLKDYHRPTLQFDLIPNSMSSFGGLKVTFSHLDPTIDCEMEMSYNWGLFTTTRQLFVTIATSNLTTTLEAFVGTDDDGNTIPQNINCHMEGNVQMTSGSETGALGGVFDFMTSTMNEKMKKMMFDQACTNITTLFNTTLYTEMSAANMSRVILDEDYFLDLKFTAPPTVTEGYIETCHVAELHLRNDSAPTNREFRAPVIPALADHNSKMAYLFVTDHLLNSAWSAALRNKKLSYTVKSNTAGLPSPVRRYLRASCSNRGPCLGTVFPQLVKLYPQSRIELELVAADSADRVVRFRGRTVEFRIHGTVNFFAKTITSRDPIFSVDAVMSGQLNVYIREDRVFFNLTNFSISSNITQIHLQNSLPNTNSKFDSFLRTVHRRFLLPYLRRLGSSGYLIPSLPWLKVTNPVIFDSRMEGVIFGTDIAVDL